MKPGHKLTPVQLVLVCFLGFVISAASLPLIRFVRTTDPCRCIRWMPALLIFGLLIAGVAVYLKAVKSLKNGVENQQWPEERLQALRSIFESPYIKAIIWALLIGYFVLWLNHPRDLGLACLLLMQVIANLKTALHPPRAPEPPPPDWRSATPIHSDHWGQR